MTRKRALNDCFLHDKDRLRHQDALNILKEALPCLAEIEQISLNSATGRVLAHELMAPRNIPAHTNAAVDGYAFNYSESKRSSGQLSVAMRIIAGDTSPRTLQEGMAARIFTGAIMPENADTVAMQEDCSETGDSGTAIVQLPAGLNKGTNTRQAGEDVASNSIIAEAGTILATQDIAALASAGFATITCYKPLKVALASNGNELLQPGDNFEAGKVYDSNRHMLRSLLQSLPVEITDLGSMGDNPEEVKGKLMRAAEDHDAIITSAGASMGEEDHITTLLEEEGTKKAWQLAIKPGRPMCFGSLQEAAFFGLPGNPVAGFVCFLLYLRPSLLKMAGANWITPKAYNVEAGFDFPNKKPDRREFWRASFHQDDNGRKWLEKYPRDGSGLISGLRAADGLIEVPESVTSVKKGDLLNFIPWSEFGI